MADGYLYGSSQEKYGQQLSCFSLGIDELDALAYAMRFSGPWIYDSALSTDASLAAALPNLTALVAGDTYYDEKAAATVAVGPYTVFAKTGAFGQDMVDKLIAPGLAQPVRNVTFCRVMRCDKKSPIEPG